MKGTQTAPLAPLFRYLGEAESERLMAIAQHRHFDAGEEIIAENSLGTEMFVILSGSVELETDGQWIALLEEGSFFGEMAIFENVPRSTSVRALESVEALSFSRKDLFRVFRKDSHLAVRLLWSLCQTMNSRLRNTTHALVRARTALR